LEEFPCLEKAGEAVRIIPMIRIQHVIAIGSFLFSIRFISTSFVIIVLVADIQTVAMKKSNCRAIRKVFRFLISIQPLMVQTKNLETLAGSTMNARFDKIDEWLKKRG